MDDILDMPDDWKIAGHDEVAGMPTKDQGMIITGLGGEGKRLRYFIVIPALNHIHLEQDFEKEVVKQFASLFSLKKSQLEKIKVRTDHIRLMLLIHMDYSVEEIVMALINEVNKVRKRLFVHYFVVNTAIPEESDIQQYVDEVEGKLIDTTLKRLIRIFPVKNSNKLPNVSQKTLINYHQHLSQHLIFPIKAKNDSGGEITILGLSDAENIDEFYGLFCVGRSNEKLVELPLAEILVYEKDKNSTLIDDYTTWFWNYR
ncbi:MAG: hypothetical protein COY80_02880 [Candidatus Pacebacteria bacterium CG_4_10_14_0_8_um_filter_42_14]|nr:MAG: hypothetical protein COY80_02880 [Candidatus Pacebacteria bacterium CG_4_10_14_0_8_um_filter_42_14]